MVDGLLCGWMPSAVMKGIKVLVHHPGDFPKVGSLGHAIIPGSEVYIGVTGEVSETYGSYILRRQQNIVSFFSHSTEATRKYTNITRDCNFEHELELEYFTVYTRSNCEVEKSVKYYVQECDCKPYFLPGI